VKGVWGETQVDDQGGSMLAAIMARFLTAIDTFPKDNTERHDDQKQTEKRPPVEQGHLHYCKPRQRLVIRPLSAYIVAMRIVIAGAPGVDQSSSTACRGLGITLDVFLADFSHLGDYRFANQGLLRHIASGYASSCTGRRLMTLAGTSPGRPSRRAFQHT
jgi:hypothetical protein